MRISKLNQFNQPHNISAGHTLIELLVSISIMGVVFSLVGAGIAFMVSSDQKLAAAQGRRTEISHTLDVISSDIRKAENVNGTQNSTPATDVLAAINESKTADGPLAVKNINGTKSQLDTTTYTPVLFLKISAICEEPTSDPLVKIKRVFPERVIYSTKAKVTGDGRIGPNILYRYGRIGAGDDSIPCISYDSTTGAVVAPPVNVPIADHIIPIPETVPGTPRTPERFSPPTLTPAATGSGTNGFYTFVSDNQVSIALFAKLTDSFVYGDNRTITSGTITTTATVLGGSASTPTEEYCTVPDLLTATTLSAANDRISTATTVVDSTISKGLSYTGIPISDGTTVLSQTPSAGSNIPCKKGLVTYTY